MSDIVVYSHLVSAPCRVLYLFLKLNNIPYDYHHIQLERGEQRTESYLNDINPHGLVPAIKDGDFRLAESVAIVQYLIVKYSTPDHWYPSDIRKRAKVDEYLSWHHSNTRAGVTDIFFSAVIATRVFGRPRDEKTVTEGKAKLKILLDIFENYFVKGKKFIAGDEISIADIFAVCEFSQIAEIAIDVGKDRPNITAWRERVTAELAPHYDEAHQPIKEMCKAFNIVEPF